MVREEDLVLQNPWWRSPDAINQDAKIVEVFKRAARTPFSFEETNTLMVGPRQVGKTTFLKMAIKALLERGTDPRRLMYFACDMLRGKAEIVEVLRLFDQLYGGRKYVFLDEVTFVHRWEDAVKFVLDSPLKEGKILYVTGSSTIGLKRERFPGRELRIREFLPLDFKAFARMFGSQELRKGIEEAGGEVNLLDAKATFKAASSLFRFIDELNALLYSYLKCGGYPRPMFELMEDGRVSEETYEAYYNAIMFDVVKLEGRDTIALSVILSLIRKYGTRFSLNAVTKYVELGSHRTVGEYLELFEDIMISRNYYQAMPGKEIPLIRKERKVFFTDPFVFMMFSKRFNLAVEEKVPAVVEGVVGEALRRRYRAVHFIGGSRELDFYTGDLGIEVKWQQRVRAGDFPRIPAKCRYLLSKVDIAEVERVAVIPASIFLLMLRRLGGRT